MQNRRISQVALFFLLALIPLVQSCTVVKDIFKAGFVSAIILIVLVVGLILFLVGRFRR